MKYLQFEELPVWQAAIALARKIYALTDDAAFKGRYSLRDQIERAAVSVSNNIAEGFERGTNQELLTFLYIARGSVGEVRSMLCLLEGMPTFRNLELGIRNLKRDTETISKQLGAWIRTLRDSGKKGQRYVSDKVRRAEKAAKDRETFLQELEQIRTDDDPDRLCGIRSSESDSSEHRCAHFGRRTSSAPRFGIWNPEFGIEQEEI